jgi:tetratricopeptide (TPR) repeat protein
MTSMLAQGDETAARAAFAEAKRLIRPEWPAEFHIHLLRREASFLRRAGDLDAAVAVQREEVQLSAATCDWRLEVIARNNLVDLLWQTGPIEEAEREAQRLAEDLRRRPATLADTDVLYANLIGILSETGQIEAASNAAREGLTVMRRTHNYFVEEWVHLAWRRGHFATAAMLLGSAEASTQKSGSPVQSNERRLMAEARAGLEQSLTPDAFARHVAAGALLGEEQLAELLSEALA